MVSTWVMKGHDGWPVHLSASVKIMSKVFGSPVSTTTEGIPEHRIRPGPNSSTNIPDRVLRTCNIIKVGGIWFQRFVKRVCAVRVSRVNTCSQKSVRNKLGQQSDQRYTVKPLNFARDLISRGHRICEILSLRNRPINSANHANNANGTDQKLVSKLKIQFLIPNLQGDLGSLTKLL